MTPLVGWLRKLAAG